jgi:hypothetical protein
MLKAMNNLAVLYHRHQARSLCLARPLFVECLEKSKSIWGENNVDTLDSMNTLTLLYYNQGQYDQARPLYEAFFDKNTLILGENHLHTLQSINSRQHSMTRKAVI